MHLDARGDLPSSLGRWSRPSAVHERDRIASDGAEQPHDALLCQVVLSTPHSRARRVHRGRARRSRVMTPRISLLSHGAVVAGTLARRGQVTVQPRQQRGQVRLQPRREGAM